MKNWSFEKNEIYKSEQRRNTNYQYQESKGGYYHRTCRYYKGIKGMQKATLNT